MKISAEKGVMGWWLLWIHDGGTTLLEFHPLLSSLLERVASLYGEEWPLEASPEEEWETASLPRKGIYR